MSLINPACTLSDIASGDKIRVYDVSNGDWRDVSVALFQTYFQANLTNGKPEYTTQYSAPSATGFSVSVTSGSNSIWLVLTPTGAFAAGTIVLPSSLVVADKQEVLVNCTQDVTTLTIDGNGATAVTGEPTSLTANDFFKLRYDAVTSTWFRVG